MWKLESNFLPGGINFITTLKVPENDTWRVDRRGDITYITTLGRGRTPKLWKRWWTLGKPFQWTWTLRSLKIYWKLILKDNKSSVANKVRRLQYNRLTLLVTDPIVMKLYPLRCSPRRRSWWIRKIFEKSARIRTATLSLRLTRWNSNTVEILEDLNHLITFITFITLVLWETGFS